MAISLRPEHRSEDAINVRIGGKRACCRHIEVYEGAYLKVRFTLKLMKTLCSLLWISTAALAWQKDEAKLPPPFATPSVRNNPRVISRPDGAQLKLPTGFTIEEYLTGFEVPRYMLLGPNKELLVSDSARNGQGCVWVFQGKQGKKLIEG